MMAEKNGLKTMSSIIDPTKPEAPQPLNDSAPKVEIEQRLQVRRKGEMVVNAWRGCDDSGEFIDGTPFVNFTGQHTVNGINPQTGKPVQGIPFDFPIGNCADFDEAFQVFFEAKELHIKVTNTMNEMRHKAAIAEQRGAAQVKQAADTVNRALGGRR